MLIFLLRLARFFCGLVAAFIFIPLLANLTSSLAVLAGKGYFLDPGAVAAAIFLQTIIFSIFAWLFFILRKWVNKIHYKKYGETHPKLGKSRWAL